MSPYTDQSARRGMRKHAGRGRAAHRRGRFHPLPGGVWALGLVSMHMDISSELVHSLLPVFMAGVLGASMTAIGLVEGTAEAAAAVTKVFSGAISDRFGKRKLPAVLGYGLSAATKPIFPLAGTIGWVFAARFTDRIGKGVRGAPRDALVADITPAGLRGAAYGLRQALDSVGAFVGPLLAVVFMVWLGGDIRKVLWAAVVPAVMAVAILVLFVREPMRRGAVSRPRNPLTTAGMRSLRARYWLVVLVGAAFSLARFSEAFLVLRGRDVGLSLVYVPVILIVMNVVYAAVSYPAGAGADRIGARPLFLAGLAALVTADILLAVSRTPAEVLLGSGLWGAHMGLTQGLLSKLVADAAPGELRGTAFGFFNVVGGASLLLASVLAGALWSAYGPAATFLTGAAFAAVAAIVLIAVGVGGGGCGGTVLSRPPQAPPSGV